MDVYCISNFQLIFVCYTNILGPPVFREPLEPITVSVGRVAVFNCDVYSNPMLQSVRWTFNGITIVSDNLRITATSTRLTINSVQSEDEGSYSCVVTNEFGFRQSSAILTIGKLCYHYYYHYVMPIYRHCIITIYS